MARARTYGVWGGAESERWEEAGVVGAVAGARAVHVHVYVHMRVHVHVSVSVSVPVRVRVG